MALPASDAFTRANENPLATGNWTQVPSMGFLQLLSNAVEVQSVGSDGCQYWNPDTPSNDQKSQITVTTLNTDTNKCVGPAVRCSTTVQSFYMIRALGPLGATATFKLYKMVTGTATQLTTATKTINAADALRLEVSGTTLTGYIAGVSQATISDAALASGRLGIFIFVDVGVPGDAVADNWTGDNLSASDTLFAQACL